jgi:hypothetical protein
MEGEDWYLDRLTPQSHVLNAARKEMVLWNTLRYPSLSPLPTSLLSSSSLYSDPRTPGTKSRPDSPTLASSYLPLTDSAFASTKSSPAGNRQTALASAHLIFSGPDISPIVRSSALSNDHAFGHYNCTGSPEFRRDGGGDLPKLEPFTQRLLTTPFPEALNDLCSPLITSAPLGTLVAGFPESSSREVVPHGSHNDRKTPDAQSSGDVTTRIRTTRSSTRILPAVELPLQNFNSTMPLMSPHLTDSKLVAKPDTRQLVERGFTPSSVTSLVPARKWDRNKKGQLHGATVPASCAASNSATSSNPPAMRTFPIPISVDPRFPRFYRRFPASSFLRLEDMRSVPSRGSSPP